jgi:two-component system sensor histidine kinase ChvG
MVWDTDIVRNRIRDFWVDTRRALSRIWIRLLAFNILLVFLPAIGLFYFQVYEKELLDSQEQSMVQQGRLLAAALSASQNLCQEASAIMDNLYPETISRLRVIDPKGLVVADSSRAGPAKAPAQETINASVTDKWLYQLGRTLFTIFRQSPLSEQSSVGPDSSYNPLDAPEVLRALEGRYGANWRFSPGQRSVTLYSAIPILQGDQVQGVVLVSQSTLRVLQKLYAIRLTVFQIVLASVLVAVILSFISAKTIASPLQILRKKASRIVDSREELGRLFSTTTRPDEIGDLERALAELSLRLDDRIRFIESFASDLSHELKNPLASIRAATELLREEQEITDRRRFLEVIETEVARMENLISKVREVTFVDSNIQSEPRSALCLNQFLEEFLTGLELQHGDEVNLTFESPASLIFVDVHADRLTQVMQNLIDNAASFTRKGSSVDTRLLQQEQWAIISVTDSGPGVPPEHQERIFDRFFSYRAGDDEHHVGLGLAIVKAIVEGYGGKIMLRETPGRGATFEVRLKAMNRFKIEERGS